jgi:hypothetical protein
MLRTLNRKTEQSRTWFLVAGVGEYKVMSVRGGVAGRGAEREQRDKKSIADALGGVTA